MNNLETLKNILAEAGVKSADINEDSNLIDLGLDSLDLIQILMDVEEKLNIHFEDDEITDFKTVKDVLTLIEKKVN